MQKFLQFPSDDSADAPGHLLGIRGFAAGGRITYGKIVQSAVVVRLRQTVIYGVCLPRLVGFENNPVFVQDRDMGRQRIEHRTGHFFREAQAPDLFFV